MIRLLKSAALALVLFAAVITALVPIGSSQVDFATEIELAVRELEYLYSRGVDVEQPIELLNKAISEYSSGRLESAYMHLQEAKRLISDLKLEEGSVYALAMATKAATVLALASIPIALYIGLPRLYLYLWYKLHRKWIVRW